MPDAHILWQSVLEELKILQPSAFATWLQQTSALDLSEGKMVVICPAQYHKDFIQTRYKKEIESILEKRLGEPTHLELQVQNTVSSTVSGPLFDQPPSPKETRKENDSVKITPINRNYSFDNFVVGNTNRVAQAAALAVSEKPGLTYNPLFIYGKTGMGKTHLLHAIGNDLSRKFPDFNSLYFTAEKFLNDFIENIKAKKDMRFFRQLYRENEAIIVDDIQFLGGKRGIQEEFYHTFNEIYASGKQIVLASDSLPKDIADLSERLVSRFRGGLMVEIGSPDFATRLAIIQSKATDLRLDLNTAMASFLAEQVNVNVREVEGALLKIKSACLAQDSPITESLLRDLFSNQSKTEKLQKLTPDLLLNLVTSTFDTSITKLCGKKRKKEIVIPRQVAMFLLRNEIGLNLTDIGELLGGRDHTTIMHGVETIKQKLASGDSYLRSHIATIRRELYS